MMSNVTLGLVSFGVLLALVFLRIPIGLSMFLCGAIGSWVITGTTTPVLSQLKQITFSTFSDYNLSVVPLFLLMGQFAAYGGISGKLFRTAENWLGHRRGAACDGNDRRLRRLRRDLRLVNGDSGNHGAGGAAGARRNGYSGALSTGTLAAGGTLGILIPPSIILVIYATLDRAEHRQTFHRRLRAGRSGGDRLHDRHPVYRLEEP